MIGTGVSPTPLTESSEEGVTERPRSCTWDWEMTLMLAPVSTKVRIRRVAVSPNRKSNVQCNRVDLEGCTEVTEEEVRI